MGRMAELAVPHLPEAQRGDGQAWLARSRRGAAHSAGPDGTRAAGAARADAAGRGCPTTGGVRQSAGAAVKLRAGAAVGGVAPGGDGARRGGGLRRLHGRLQDEVPAARRDGCGQGGGGGGAAERSAGLRAAGAAGRRRAEQPPRPALPPGRVLSWRAALLGTALRPEGLPGQHDHAGRRSGAPGLLPPQMLRVLAPRAGRDRAAGEGSLRRAQGRRARPAQLRAPRAGWHRRGAGAGHRGARGAADRARQDLGSPVHSGGGGADGVQHLSGTHRLHPARGAPAGRRGDGHVPAARDGGLLHEWGLQR